MAYNILAINPGHNGSVALVSDGELIYYCEEERVSRSKYDGNPFKAMINVLSSFVVDELIIGGTTNQFPRLTWTNEDPYTALVRKYNPNVKVTYMGHLHHMGHATSGFYNSGFDTAVAIVIDGAGSYQQETIPSEGQENTIGGYEVESIYHCSYPMEFEAVYKRYSDGNYNYYDNGLQEFDGSVPLTKAYEAVSQYLGFGFIEAGKTMGLAPYGTDDADIPEFFVDGKGNRNLLIPAFPAGALIDENRNINLKRFDQSFGWHTDPSLIRDIDKNIAYKIQKSAEEYLVNLIQKAIDITGETNIVLSGGFALNCVANYKLLKYFPHVNFFIDPIAHDGGTAIGLAKYAWHNYSGSTDIKPLESVYLGGMIDYNQLDSLLEQVPTVEITDVTADDVAELLENGNIVALVQGRSEGGPRALGNRSILFDPRHAQGKDIVNIVKQREWFRPFAASVLEEHADEWFDLAALAASPFMMYAVDVREDKVAEIPAVTHVDNTCRVQTVNKDNENYYNLIEAFYKRTQVPLILNTSFNLAGQPLVESLVDAFVTLVNSDLKYLYLADVGKLVSKTDK